jgi:ABC-type lipoprotein release transport system permease subunit
VSAADRRIRLQIAWHSLRWRAGATLVMLLISVIAVGAGVFGPLYLDGSDQSVLQHELTSAPPSTTGLSLVANANAVSVAQLDRAIAAVPRLTPGRSLVDKPIITTSHGAEVTQVHNHQPFATDLISRTGACAHVRFADGHCPTAARTVALSTRTAKELDLQVGSTIDVNLNHVKSPVALVVAGLYVAPNPFANFWWGFNYFGYGEGSTAVPELDDLITSQATALALPQSGGTPLLAQLPIDTAQLDTGNVDALEHALSSYRFTSAARFDVTTSSELSSVLSSASSDEHTLDTIVLIVLAQLILLALIVLYAIASRTAKSRQADVELAELRGFSWSGRASVALLEPVAVLTAAVPLGLLVGWVASAVAAHSLFKGGGTPSLALSAVGAGLLVYAGGLVAAAFGARGLVRRAPARSASQTRSLATGIALDAVVVGVAVVALIEVGTSGVSSGTHTDLLAALAPGLVAFALGVIGARLLPLLARSALKGSKNSSRVGRAVAIRRLSRLPRLSRHVVVLSISVGLATFAVTGWAVAAHNRTTRALFAVGASRVLTVEVQPGVDLLSAVRQVDPSGRRAMAAVIEEGSDGTTLAVDASRFAAVAAWPPGLTSQSPSQLAASLSRAPGPAVELHGSAIRLTVDLLQSITPPPELQISLFDDAYQTPSTLDLGALVPGVHQYRASTQGSCSTSCRLVNVGVTWSPPGTSTITAVTVPFTISAIATQTGDRWTTVPAGLIDPGYWTGGDQGGADVRLSRSATGLSVRAVAQEFGGATVFGPDDVPTYLPAIVVGASTGQNLGVGLDGSTVNLATVAAVPSLPGIGASGALVDLGLAERLQQDPMIDTVDQVWLSAGAPSDLVARLAQRGISVLSTRTQSQESNQLAHSGISFAFSFFLAAAVLAALLAIGATAFVLLAEARGRLSEFAALQAIGIGRAFLRRALLAEEISIVVLGATMGVIAGVVATAVALPSIPEFISLGPGPPLDYGLRPLPFVIVVAAVVLALVITVGLIAPAMVRRARTEGLTGEGA